MRASARACDVKRTYVSAGMNEQRNNTSGNSSNKHVKPHQTRTSGRPRSPTADVAGPAAVRRTPEARPGTGPDPTGAASRGRGPDLRPRRRRAGGAARNPAEPCSEPQFPRCDVINGARAYIQQPAIQYRRNPIACGAYDINKHG